MEKLKDYLKSNFIGFQEISDSVLKIGEETYELYKENEEGSFFDSDFFWDCDKTEYDNYIFSFGSRYYYFKKGQERSVKLNDVKYIGRAEIDPVFEIPCYLGIHGPFEILNGVGDYEEWCKKAKFLGIKTLGICEKGTLAGVLKFQKACDSHGLKSIIGMEIPVLDEEEDHKYTVKAFVKNEEGWQNLLSINKEVNVENSGFISSHELVKREKGLIFVMDPKTLQYKRIPEKIKDLANYYQLDTVVYEKEERDELYLENLKNYYDSSFEPIAMCDSFCTEKEYGEIKKKLNRIAKDYTHDSQNQYFKNFQEYYTELSALFGTATDSEEMFFATFELAIENLCHVCDCCNFSIDTEKRHLPHYKMTEEEKRRFPDNPTMLRELVYEGLVSHPEFLERYTDEKLIERIEEELDVIEFGDVVDYFLILRDIINWARSQGMKLGAGRGSAVSSLVTRLLDITYVDPFEHNLIFSRFINKGRIAKSLPDIDSDFASEDRPLIKEYMEQRFGDTQVCSVGTYTTLQIKAAITDIGRLDGINLVSVKRFTKKFGTKEKTREDFFKVVMGSDEMKKFVREHTETINDALLVLGNPKAPSIHACAMMIFPDEKTMFQWAPIRKTNGMMVTEWEGNELDSAGFLKEDILGIEQLDKFSDMIKLIKENHGVEIDLYKDISYTDKKVFEFFKNGWNGDVFHFGAKGLSKYCTQLAPDSLEDLIAAAALYRPGTIENNYHNEYILRKNGERPVEYRTGTESVLKNTYGITIFQEQVMHIMGVLAGMDSVAQDDVRKALGKKKLHEMEKIEKIFVPEYIKRFGVTEEYAKDFWSEIVKSSSYLFNLSHAAAYSINGYNCQWLKVHYPIEFWSVTFSRAKMEEFPFYINEINATGNIKIQPVDINKSDINIVSDVETNSMYWAINSVNQVGPKAQEQLMKNRTENGPYFSLVEFLDRNTYTGSSINKSVVENLIYSGAFDSISHIQEPKEREGLLLKYREINSVKVNGEKDAYTEALVGNKTKEDWWWQLQQKKQSGFGFFSYKDLVKKYRAADIDNFVEVKEIMEWDGARRGEVIIGGYVLEDPDERTSKKGLFCNLVLESNYEFIKVLIFPEIYEEVKEVLSGCKGKILLINGNPQWNKFHECYVLQTTNNTQISMLS